MELESLVNRVVQLARKAGYAVLDIYNSSDFDVKYKTDSSPLTKADSSSHKVIVEGLAEICSAPILSEEGERIDYTTRSGWQRYWLIDPLDGTKEFIKRNGEFTINIALIEKGMPKLGVVYAPAKDLMYYGVHGGRAYKMTNGGLTSVEIHPSTPPKASARWRIVGSRSHESIGFKAFVAKFSCFETVTLGSSLKLCLVADGSADVYPRLGPTCEWDTAAAQAVVEAAGGMVVDAETLQPLRYNQKESLLNPSFIVCAELSSKWT